MTEEDVSRGRAAAEGCAALAVGGVLLALGHPVPAAIAGGMGALVLAGGLFAPPLYRVLRRAGRALGRAAGLALTWALLAPFFYLCFTAGRVILLLARRDPMQRAIDRAAPTYWRPHPGPPPLERYSRQY